MQTVGGRTALNEHNKVGDSSYGHPFFHSTEKGGAPRPGVADFLERHRSRLGNVAHVWNDNEITNSFMKLVEQYLAHSNSRFDIGVRKGPAEFLDKARQPSQRREFGHSDRN